MRILIDTNVLISAALSAGGVPFNGTADTGTGASPN